MARPERIVITDGQQAWDGEVDLNFEQLTDAPMPMYFAADLSSLNTDFSPANYDQCLALIGTVLYISDGATWEVYREGVFVADSTAATVSELATDFNTLLASLQGAGIMAIS